MTDTEKKPEELKLERETCGRCGGSGNYGPLSVCAGKCFDCGGRGTRYTKRGAVANAFLTDLLSVRADSLKVGDLIRQASITHGGAPFSYWARVYAIVNEVQRYKSLRPGETSEQMDAREWQEKPVLVVKTKHAKFGEVGNVLDAESRVRRGWSAEEKRAAVLKAIEFQNTLTKAGKPRKEKK